MSTTVPVGLESWSARPATSVPDDDVAFGRDREACPGAGRERAWQEQGRPARAAGSGPRAAWSAGPGAVQRASGPQSSGLGSPPRTARSRPGLRPMAVRPRPVRGNAASTISLPSEGPPSTPRPEVAVTRAVLAQVTEPEPTGRSGCPPGANTMSLGPLKRLAADPVVEEGDLACCRIDPLDPADVVVRCPGRAVRRNSPLGAPPTQPHRLLQPGRASCAGPPGQGRSGHRLAGRAGGVVPSGATLGDGFRSGPLPRQRHHRASSNRALREPEFRWRTTLARRPPARHSPTGADRQATVGRATSAPVMKPGQVVKQERPPTWASSSRAPPTAP